MYTSVTEHKNKIYCTENKNGETSYHVIDNFQPSLFADNFNESAYKGYPYFNNLERITFDSIKEFKNYNFTMKDVIGDFFGNVPAEFQYIHQCFNKEDSTITRTHLMDIETNVEDKFPDPVKAEQPITFIQCCDNVDNDIKIFLWQREYTRKPDEDVEIIKCDSERDLIDRWLEFYHRRKPHLVTGWNFIGFDLRYLTNRLRNLGYKDGMLSPFGKTETKKYTQFNEDFEVEYPIGVTWMDYADIFYKHAFIKTPDKKLDTAAQVVLGGDSGKLDWKEYFLSFKDMAHQIYTEPMHPSEAHKESNIYKLNQARKNYQEGSPEFEKISEAMKQECFNIFTDYSILDVRLLKDMDDKIKMTSLVFGYAWAMGINPPDVLGTVKPWTMLLYGTFLDKGVVIPSKMNNHEFYAPAGGLWDATPGLWKWIMSQDFTSLYPLNAVSLNMSPETIIEDKDIPQELMELVLPLRRYKKDAKWLDRDDNMDIYIDFPEEKKEKIASLCEKYNYTFATNGTFFSKEKKGFIPIEIEKIFAQRKKYKKLMKSAGTEAKEIEAELKRRGV